MVFKYGPHVILINTVERFKINTITTKRLNTKFIYIYFYYHHGYGLHTWGKDILVYYLKPAQLGEEYIGINTFIGEPL